MSVEKLAGEHVANSIQGLDVGRVLEIIGTHGGPFAIGAVFGYLANYFSTRQALSFDKDSRKFDHETLQQLRAQIAVKDERIEKLHRQIQDLLKENKQKSDSSREK